MRLGPLRYVLCALVAALVVFTSGGAAASGHAQRPASVFSQGVPTPVDTPAETSPFAQCGANEAALVTEEPDGGVTAEAPLASMPAEDPSPPVFIPSDDACDPAFQVEAGPAMCTTDGASAVAPRVIHVGATTTLDAPERCSHELSLGATYDRDEQPHERPPSVALEACLFASPALAPPSVAKLVSGLRPRDHVGRHDARRLERPPRV